MTPSQVLALINQYIIANGVGAITGPILNTILTAIVNLVTTSETAVTQIVSSSGTLALSLSNQYTALQRNFNLAAMVIDLPPGASAGQSFTIEDVVGNLNAYPATVTPPGGQTIGGRANYVMNINFQSATFRYYGNNIWSAA